MAKYNWNLQTLEKRLNDYFEFYKNETDHNKRENIWKDIITLHHFVKKEYPDYFDENDACFESINYKNELFNDYEDYKQRLEEIRFLEDDLKKFYQISSDKSYNLPVKITCNLTEDEILILTHDFYEQLNPYFYKNFMKNFRRRKNHVRFIDKENSPCDEGRMFFLKNTKEAFLQIGTDGTFRDLFTTIHEYGHSTSAQINPSHLNPEKELYSEIDSIFMELIAYDFFDRELNNYAGTIEKAHYHETYSSIAEKANAIISLANLEKKLGTSFRYDKNSDYSFVLNAVTNLSTEINDYFYVTSYIFALELYDLYKKDKEKALDTLKKIILLDGNSEKQFYDDILDLGITPNASLEKFQNDLDKEVEKTKKLIK